MDKDIIREINQYFIINNANIENINKVLAEVNGSIGELKNIVTELGQHLDLLEKTYRYKQVLKN